MKVLLIVPAYNEAENIISVVDDIKNAGYDYIVVNDGSKDKTADICRENGINIIDLSQNLGIGGAVQAGHLYAIQHGYDVDVQFDGDGQHDIGYVKNLLTEIEQGADLVIGSRFLEKTDGFQSSTLRRLGIRWLSFWIRLFTGTRISDATSGFRASGAHAISLFCQNYPTDYPEPESIVLAHKMGLTVKETSVIMHARKEGASSIGSISSVYYMLKVSLAIAILGFNKQEKRG